MNGGGFAFRLTAVILSGSKYVVSLSTLGQAIFLFLTLPRALNLRSIPAQIAIFYAFLSIIVSINAIVHGLTFYSIKNLAYVFALPLVCLYFRFDHVKWFAVGLLTALIALHFVDDQSYITRELGGSARYSGFFVNPNVAGVGLVLMIIMFKADPWRAIVIPLLIAMVAYTGSRTAIILLAMALMPLWAMIPLGLAAAVAIFVIPHHVFLSNYPSLWARFELWSNYLPITPEDILWGRGFDYFGAGINTVADSSIRVADSFFISSLLSGGAPYLVLLTFVFFLYPAISALNDKRHDILRVVAVFAVANSTGNFLENGFPANLIFVSMVWCWLYDRDRGDGPRSPMPGRRSQAGASTITSTDLTRGSAG